MQIYSFSPFGYEGSLVTVEVDIRRGIPAVDIVGLADSAVKESRERMQAAIRNSGFDFPPERVLISLSPADLKKEGAGFDLPIAIGVLYAQTKSDEAASEDGNKSAIDDSVLIMGELELSGRIRPVRGVHAAAATAAAGGIMRCIVPSTNADEAREVSGMRVFGADNLMEAFSAVGNDDVFTFNREKHSESSAYDENLFDDVNGVFFQKSDACMDFAEIRGQEKLVRGLSIAAAGGHSLLAVGAPGCGKTMAIQKYPAIAPILTVDESQSVTRIYSISGLLPAASSSIRIPPFRIPHQTASIEGMCGGGQNCRPGEISLAHNGVLFLDEAAEFKTSVLQMLRVPLESGQVTLSRAGRTSVFPASFQLFMASNPCPCGNYGSKTKLCLCSTRAIEMYWKKFSAPLLDRMEIRIAVEYEGNKQKNCISTLELRKKIASAVKIQRKRQGTRNAKLSPPEVAKYCCTDFNARSLLDFSAERYGFSPRAVSSCLKFARTIADMNGEDIISKTCMSEAVEFRKSFSNFMEV